MFDSSAGVLGNFGASVAWDGDGVSFSSSTADISVGNIPGIPIGSSPRSFTFEWSVPSFATDTQACILSLSTAPSAGTGIWIFAEDNAISVGFSGHRIITPKSTLATDTRYWTSIVVPDGATTTAEVLVYINGVLQSTSLEAGENRTLATDTVDVVFGNDYEPDDSFQGKFYAFFAHDFALTVDDVAALHRDPYQIFDSATSPAIMVSASAQFLNRDLSWQIFHSIERSTGWGILAAETADTGYRILSSIDRDIAAKILTATDQDTAYKILNAVTRDSASRILTRLDRNSSWAILSKADRDTSWNIINSLDRDMSWQVLLANILEADLAWQILTSAVTDLDIAWAIKTAKEQITGYRIMAVEDQDTAWNIANAVTVDIAWPILIIKDQQAAWGILSGFSRDTSWKVFNIMDQDLAWALLARLEQDTGWQLFDAADINMAWDILSDIVPEPVKVFMAERRTFIFNAERRTFIFFA